MKHSIDEIEQYMKNNIKENFSSSYTPSNSLWFRRLYNDNYIGGDIHTVCHIEIIDGISFSTTLLDIKG